MLQYKQIEILDFLPFLFLFHVISYQHTSILLLIIKAMILSRDNIIQYVESR